MGKKLSSNTLSTQLSTVLSNFICSFFNSGNSLRNFSTVQNQSHRSGNTGKSSTLKRPNGYRLQDQSILRNVFAEAAVCGKCLNGKLQLWEKPIGCGLARTLVLLCSNTKCKAVTELPTSEKKSVGKSRFYDVNRRSTLAMRLIGRAALVKFTAIMNMPGSVKKKSFATHVSRIAKVSKLVAEADMQKVGNDIRREMGEDKYGIVDLSVSCDGTWARRGYQSLYGMVSAIHVESGKVLDYEASATSAGRNMGWTIVPWNMPSGWKNMPPFAMPISQSPQRQWNPILLSISGDGLKRNEVLSMSNLLEMVTAHHTGMS